MFASRFALRRILPALLSAFLVPATASPLRFAGTPVVAPPSSGSSAPVWSAAVDCAPPVVLSGLIGARVVLSADFDLDGTPDAADTLGISPADCDEAGRIPVRRRLAFAHPALLRAELRAADGTPVETHRALTHGAGSLLRIERYCARPRNGEPEWIEVRNRSGHPVALANVRLEGRTLSHVVPPVLAPGAGFTAGSDTAELRLWQPGAAVAGLSSWSNLRNSADTLRIAFHAASPVETLVLDSVRYAAPAYPREDCASLAEDGSSGAAAGYRVTLPSGAWRRGDPGFAITVEAPAEGRYSVRVLDLDGVPRCHLLREATGPARISLPDPRCRWLSAGSGARTVLLHVQPRGAPGVRRVLRVLP